MINSYSILLRGSETMIKHEMATKIAALACLAALLSGCGGKSKAEKCEEQYRSILGQLLCNLSDEVPNTQSQSAKGSGVTSAVSASIGEYEPNNLPDNANVLSLPAGTISGSVQKGDDASDFYVFTPPHSGSYRISVCEGICASAAQDDAVYVMVYDQSQTTIASTPVGTVSAQEVTAELTVGMAYYIEVNGYNADAFAYDYRLDVERD